MTSTHWTWIRVNRKQRCLICGKPDWCTFSPEHGLACCMRIQSAKPSKCGGWLHQLTEIPEITGKSAKPTERRPNLTALHAISLKFTPAAAVERLSRLLGVSTASLQSLGAAWQPARKAWLFPMRDDLGNIIGLRCRAENGRKWAVTGSRNGLFIPQLHVTNGECWICEGPTDTAAAIDLLHFAIGRSDCNGGCEYLKRFIRQNRIERVTIVADRDKAGQNGAHKLGRELGVTCRVWSPPHGKDLREWYLSEL